MENSTQALLVFIVTQTVNVGSLIVDFFLIKVKYPTITEIAVRYPMVGTGFIIFEVLAPLSLGLHFYFSKDNYNFPINARNDNNNDF